MHHELRDGEEPHGLAGPDGGGADRDGEVGLAPARLPVEDEVLACVDEGERPEVGLPVAVGERDPGEVVAVERLGRGEPRPAHPPLQLVGGPDLHLPGQQALDRPHLGERRLLAELVDDAVREQHRARLAPQRGLEQAPVGACGPGHLRHPHEAVVDAEVHGLVVGDGPRGGARRADGDRRLVDAAGRLVGEAHRLQRGLPSGGGRLVAHRPQLGLQARPVQRVHMLPELVGERLPHPAVLPAAGVPRQQGELRGGAGRVGRGAAVGPGVLADELAAVGVVDAHGRRPQADREPAARERRVRGVEVAAPLADRDLALLVGGARDVGDAVEGLGRQPEHRQPVGLEEIELALALYPVGLVGHGEAALEQPAVEGAGVPQLGDGDEEVAAHAAHLVLDAALLVARAGVAEPEAEAVVGAAGGEQLGRPDPAADAAADAGRVVEDDLGRHAADALEDVAQGLADALRRLAREDLGQPDVGVRERHHEEAQRGPHPPHVEVGLAEVGLRLAGAPDEVEVPGVGRLRRAAGPNLPDAPLHGADGDVGAALGDEPVVDALCGMALLASAAHVVVEPGLDQGPVRVEL